MKNKLKLIFDPRAFDEFEGTQEELDELVNQIRKKFEDGSLLEDSKPVNLDDLDEVTLEKITSSFKEIDEKPSKKTLH
jgi:hypothetical protein